MEKKKLKKLTLSKETVSALTPGDQSHIMGGGTTSFNYDQGTCGDSNLTCCGPGSASIPKSCCNSGCGTCYYDGGDCLTNSYHSFCVC
jgi:hypothetical protein